MKMYQNHTRILALLLALCTVTIHQNEAQAIEGNPKAIPQLPGDVDLGHGYVRRDGAIHFIGGGITGTGDNATRIDTPSPEILKMAVDFQFGPFKTCAGLDVESFKALSESYTRDKDRVYLKVISTDVFLVIVLPEADPTTFQVIATDLARDKNHVWLSDKIQPGADPATLQVVNAEFTVFKDKDSVHYQGETIAGADPASFIHLGSGYYRDKSRVYWGTDPVADADPATFEVLGDSFVAKDKNRVYRSGESITGFDAKSIQLILHDPAGHQILSDKNGIHVNTMTFPRSRPVKTKVIDNHTVIAGDLVLLVERSRKTPVTVFREKGKLMAEAPAYEPTIREVLGTITAEVGEASLENIRIAPLPGSNTVPTVADWQMECFNNPDALQRYLEAGKHIK
jgi:hypothetical protein